MKRRPALKSNPACNTAGRIHWIDAPHRKKQRACKKRPASKRISSMRGASSMRGVPSWRHVLQCAVSLQCEASLECSCFWLLVNARHHLKAAVSSMRGFSSTRASCSMRASLPCGVSLKCRQRGVSRQCAVSSMRGVMPWSKGFHTMNRQLEWKRPPHC